MTTMIIRGHRFNRAYSDALCPRSGGKRQQYRLYQRPDRLCSRCGGATERAAARQAGRPYRPGKDPDLRPDRLRPAADPHGDGAVSRQLGVLRFLLGLPMAHCSRPQTLLVYNSTNQIAGRIFSYNQSFRDLGNVTGPLVGAGISASFGFRAVFIVTAGVVLFNAVYSWLSLSGRYARGE